MGRKGFTLIEISMVAVIIGILASLAVVRYWKVGEKTKAVEAELILEKARAGYTAMLFEGPIPVGWNPDIIAASDADWRKIGMANPNALAGGFFAYQLSGSSMVAFRRTTLAAYSASYDSAKNLSMNLVTGAVTKSDTYR
jgi:prepilin-type N-terminal cleavage/methylation domain-containing protein